MQRPTDLTLTHARSCVRSVRHDELKLAEEVEDELEMDVCAHPATCSALHRRAMVAESCKVQHVQRTACQTVPL